MFKRSLLMFLLIALTLPHRVVSAQEIDRVALLDIQRRIDILRELINQYIEARLKRGATPKTELLNINTTLDDASGNITVSWATNNLAKGKVYYSTTPVNFSSSSSASDDLFKKSHSFELRSLLRGTTYYFVAEATDESGVTTRSRERQFSVSVDETPPKISRVDSPATETSVKVGWETNEPATSQVFWSESAAVNLNQSKNIFKPTLTDKHSIDIEGLSPNTTYYFIVKSKDRYNNETVSNVRQFKTPSPDTTPPDLFNLTVTNLADKGVTINWTTSEDTIGKLYYGGANKVSTLQSDFENIENFGKAHSVELKDLTPNFSYSYIIELEDRYRNITRTSMLNFKTQEDTVYPKISDIVVLFREPYKATISWKTDEKTTGNAYHKSSPNVDVYGLPSAADVNISEEHFVTIDLSPNTTYYFRIKSIDTSGNTTISDEKSVKTP